MMHCGSGCIAPYIRDLGIRWRSASCPNRFTPRERAPGTHWIGVWVGPRASLDAVVKRKIPSPCQKSNPQSSSPWLTYPSSLIMRFNKTGCNVCVFSSWSLIILFFLLMANSFDWLFTETKYFLLTTLIVRQ
jgi:hypothetical protein